MVSNFVHFVIFVDNNVPRNTRCRRLPTPGRGQAQTLHLGKSCYGHQNSRPIPVLYEHVCRGWGRYDLIFCELLSERRELLPECLAFRHLLLDDFDGMHNSRVALVKAVSDCRQGLIRQFA